MAAAFSLLIGNGDMHAKNWSLTYPDRRRARLSPAYDLVSTIAHRDDAELALNLWRGQPKAMARVTFETLASLATTAFLPRRQMVRAAWEVVERFMDIWPQEKGHLPLWPGHKERIDQHLKTLEILRQTQGPSKRPSV